MKPTARQLTIARNVSHVLVGLAIILFAFGCSTTSVKPPQPVPKVQTDDEETSVAKITPPMPMIRALTASAIQPTYYFRAFYNLDTNAEAISSGGAYGLYCSPKNQQANLFLGSAPEGTSRIAFTGPLPANPINLWVTYQAGEFNFPASPVVTLDTSQMLLSTNPNLPRIVYLKPQIVLPPPTNLTISINTKYPGVTIQGSTNLHDWHDIATTSNGLMTVICDQFAESYRARVDAATVTLTWTPSDAPNVTGYVILEYDMATNVITTWTIGNTNQASVVVSRPDRRVYFALESYDGPDAQIGPPSALTYYTPTWPTLNITR